MPVQKILVHPDQRLRQISTTITSFDPNLATQFAQLEQTMRAGIGGIGIAAPQIGDNRRFIIVDCRESLRPCKHHGLLYMANPAIESGSGEKLGREGCLSVPDWVGMVPRAAKITVSYHDPQGIRHKITASGFEARVIQHEIDHLDGILFIDRVVSSKSLVRRLST
ncbi:MAG: peptide deformylase [Mariprofundus sp.]|nr:peptide deformylase [Mariprofundus sp.]